MATVAREVTSPTTAMHKAILGEFPGESQGTKALYDEWAKTIDDVSILFLICQESGPIAKDFFQTFISEILVSVESLLFFSLPW